MTEREHFELWATSPPNEYFSFMVDGEEIYEGTIDAWKGWQARAALAEQESDKLKRICGESYQVVGSLASSAGLFDHPAVIKALDNLSKQELMHDDVLPFVAEQEAQPLSELALNVQHADCHKAAAAFWNYWEEFGETHKHGFYESTWGAINAAIRVVGVVPHVYGTDGIDAQQIRDKALTECLCLIARANNRIGSDELGDIADWIESRIGKPEGTV